jgi:hypothetical protein
MTCVNIVDHRNHSNNPKCDAVLESVPVISPRSPTQVAPVPDIEFLRNSTVAKVVNKAQCITDPVTIWLYDCGSISNEEVRECRK